ncbi:MAG: C39 family peptidase [Candidatus Moranbacteria bacterium]|nr:C39 family peptidase [Candidatus Moranbacteria bacterium]
MKKKLLISLSVALLLLGAGYLLVMFLDKPMAPIANISSDKVMLPDTSNNQPAQPIQTIQSSQSATTASAVEIKNTIQLDVPFIVQAPFGNWSNPVFQNGCEEASIAMAMNWIRGIDDVSQFSARKQILDIVDFEDANFGYNADTDVFDVAKIFQRYFQYQSVEVKESIVVDDIKQALRNGQLVMVPAFGQALGNPNYTAPGPIEHMLVVIGYDPATREFITNDPGTRKGDGYRYDENVFFNAIWAYPSGSASVAVPTGKLKKAMVVVQK